MKGSKFYASGSQTLTTVKASCLGITSTAATRLWVWRIFLGAMVNATPEDEVSEWIAQRHSAAGTSTPVTPGKRDLADPAAIGIAGENHTVEPTVVTNETPLEHSLHHRSAFDWVDDDGIILPATAAAGLHIHTLHAASTSDFRASADWVE